MSFAKRRMWPAQGAGWVSTGLHHTADYISAEKQVGGSYVAATNLRTHSAANVTEWVPR